MGHRCGLRVRGLRAGLIALAAAAGAAGAEDGVFVRFRMTAPAEGTHYVKLGGYIHVEPWYLPVAGRRGSTILPKAALSCSPISPTPRSRVSPSSCP
jgi:hypothetical protein